MSLKRVEEYFKKYDMEKRIIVLKESSATVELAALALGCKPELIAKTLSFKVDGKAILIVMAGDVKVDNAKYKGFFHTKATMLTKEELEEMVGHNPGGVCPFGINDGVSVYLDVSLKRFVNVYPACGSANSAIKLSIEELEKYSNYIEWIDVSKLME
ncbi:MAG: YbaK/EbsC family protein [Bacilli bacterium]